MKIAAFAHTLDPLFLRKIPKGIELFFLVPQGLSNSSWLKKQTTKKKVIHFTTSVTSPLHETSDDDLLKCSDITECLKKHGISYLMPSHRGTTYLATWSKRHKISLISPETKHQIQFEDKAWFDSFLAKRNFPKPPGMVLKGSNISFKSPCVIQEPRSFGSFGTFIVKDKKTLSNLKKSGVIKANNRYLVRSFIPGKTYGITLYLDKNHIILSACRMQCFYKSSNAQPLFAGIQWIPSRTLGRKAIETINDTFIQLGFLMQSSGFEGYAHFDFILTATQEISILECNPRLSSATPHLFSCPELTGGFNTGALFLGRSKQKLNNEIKVSGFPDSRYEGSLLDLVCLKKNATLDNPVEIGTYAPYKGSFRKSSPSRLPDLSSKEKRLLFTGLESSGVKVQYQDTVGSLITNFPLFELEGTLSKDGNRAISFFDMLS